MLRLNSITNLINTQILLHKANQVSTAGSTEKKKLVYFLLSLCTLFGRRPNSGMDSVQDDHTTTRVEDHLITHYCALYEHLFHIRKQITRSVCYIGFQNILVSSKRRPACLKMMNNSEMEKKKRLLIFEGSKLRVCSKKTTAILYLYRVRREVNTEGKSGNQ